MIIKYNLTGEKRKALVSAISKEINAQAKYLGAPKFSFEVGSYTIDKNGTVTGHDNSELVGELLGLYDFKAVSEEYENPYPKGKDAPAFKNLKLTGNDELGCPNRNSPYRDFEEPPRNGTPENCSKDRLAIEIPKEGFSDEAIANLQKLIDSKANLLNKALGATNLNIEQTETKLRFPWFYFDTLPEKVNAYTHLISALCAMAKTLNRVNSEPKDVDNEKYAFRCFLLRLGFIGEKYKAERKILLKNMEGNSAFKKQNSSKAVMEDA